MMVQEINSKQEALQEEMGLGFRIYDLGFLGF
jgi:hypothetical protein